MNTPIISPDPIKCISTFFPHETHKHVKAHTATETVKQIFLSSSHECG